MRIRELKSLLALAEERHFTRAAELCHITQPTLSAQIKKLENTLGAPIFERQSKELQLTAYGEAVVPVVRDVLQKLHDIRLNAQHGRGTQSTTLRLGVLASLNPYLLFWFLPAFRAVHRNAALSVHEGRPRDLVRLVQGNQLDAALTTVPIENFAVDGCAVFDEPIHIACSSRHRLANKPSIVNRDVAAPDLIVPEDGYCFGPEVIALLRGRSQATDCGGSAPSGVSIAAAIQMVNVDMGFTLLPALATSHAVAQVQDLVVREVSGYTLRRRIGLVWHRDCTRIESLQSFAMLIRSCLPNDFPVAY